MFSQDLKYCNSTLAWRSQNQFAFEDTKYRNPAATAIIPPLNRTHREYGKDKKRV